MHDFKLHPELTNSQMNGEYFSSPHKQIMEDFDATVVKVHDGDTITLSTTFRSFDFPLRFADIDAPEMNAGGEVARDWLRSKILGQKISVEIDDRDRVDKWGRLLGRVFYMGLDVGQEQVYLGLSKPFGEIGDEIPNLKKEFAIEKWL